MLTRGIARGAGSSDVVGSPTFTLSKVYKTQKFDIHHFDFFRLKEAGLMEHELASMFEDREAVLVLEWSDVVQHTLPTSRLTVTINKTSDTSRELLCIYPKTLSYLMET